MNLWIKAALVAIIFAASTAGVTQASETVIYYHTDALGTPVAITDAVGNVIERSEYEPYGRLLNRPLSDGPGYTGHVSDAQTGLSYMQQRYYDPGIGRFLSRDPVTANANTGANFNAYWYANNNPYTFTDPDGRESGAFYTNAQYQMAQPTTDGIGLIADFVPVISDAKGIYDAYREPTFRNITAAGVGFLPVIGDAGGKLIKNVDNIADVGKAAANRGENVAKGIPESRLGPSGKPKVHTVDHSTRKGAKEAAERQTPPGGKVRNDAHPQDGQRPHFQAEDAKGNNVKPVVHHCKPNKAC